MNNLIAQNESLTMSSVEISTLTGKRHDHVLRDIKKMLLELYPAGAPNFEGSYLSEQNKKLQLFNLDRKHTDCLLTGYSAKARMAVIERWYSLELRQPVPVLPQNYLEALEHLIAKEKQLIEQAPKVAFVDRFIESTGNKSFREVAKILKANEREFRAFLYESKVMYQLGGGWTAHAQHIDAGRFYVTGGESNGHAYTVSKFTPKGIEYIAGKWIAHKELI